MANFEKDNKNMHFESGSVQNQEDLEKAAELVSQGFAVGIYNRGVCAIVGNGDDPTFPEVVRKIKGEERGNKPLAAMIPTRDFVELLDPKKISSELHDLFLDAEKLARRTGSLCFIRGPIKKEAALSLPKSMVFYLNKDTPVVQNWDPEGNNPAHFFVERIRKNGVKYPAVTSMNKTGMPEIVDQEEGRRFSKESGIPYFLEDPLDKRRAIGSYTILSIDDKGIGLVRDGNIPGAWFEKILQKNIDASSAIPSKFRHPDAPKHFDRAHPDEARMAIIAHLHQ